MFPLTESKDTSYRGERGDTGIDMNWFGRLMLVSAGFLLLWGTATRLLVASWAGLVPRFELVFQIVLVGTVLFCGVGVYGMFTALRDRFGPRNEV